MKINLTSNPTNENYNSNDLAGPKGHIPIRVAQEKIIAPATTTINQIVLLYENIELKLEITYLLFIEHR